MQPEPPDAVAATPRLLTPKEADELLRFPRGRSARLARKRLLPHIRLPDGSIRFAHNLLDLLAASTTEAA